MPSGALGPVLVAAPPPRLRLGFGSSVDGMHGGSRGPTWLISLASPLTQSARVQPLTLASPSRPLCRRRASALRPGGLVAPTSERASGGGFCWSGVRARAGALLCAAFLSNAARGRNRRLASLGGRLGRSLSKRGAPAAASGIERSAGWFGGVQDDARRRWSPTSYLRDWTDGVTSKSIATVAFMYFACLAPVVAFGQLTGTVTGGVLGVPHFLAGAALGGVSYAVLCGQPMTMIGPTGLTFAYVTALWGLCQTFGWPFLSLYAWTGIWCSGLLALLACGGACSLVSLVTQFTDDVFNGLIVITFLATACRNIAAPFAAAGMDKTVPFLDAGIALGTFAVAALCNAARSGPYFRPVIRNLLADFGPVIAMVTATVAARYSSIASVASVNGLAVPSVFDLGRPLLVPLLPSGGVPLWVPAAAVVPALLLTLLFFLDQNITSRVVNNPSNGLRKGATYHLDLLVVAGITLALSLMGLPWMVAATVQSLSHVRAMATATPPSDGATSAAGKPSGEVVETRLTGTLVHLLIGGSVALLPLLRLVPASAISGLFLFLGMRMTGGNAFFARLPLLFRDPEKQPSSLVVKPSTAHAFTALQAFCLTGLWVMRSVPATALLFPSVILMLVAVRLRLVPRLFSRDDLEVLDELLPEEIAQSRMPERFPSSA